jgi:hypothetical protein
MDQRSAVIFLPFVLTILIICAESELIKLIIPADFMPSNIHFFSHASLLSGLNESGTIRVLTNHSVKQCTNVFSNMIVLRPVYEVWMGVLENSTFGVLLEQTSRNLCHFFNDGSGRTGWEIAADLAEICPPPISIVQKMFMKAVSAPAPAPSRLMNMARVGGLFRDKCRYIKRSLRRLLGMPIGNRGTIGIRARRYDFLEEASLSILIVDYLFRFLMTPSVLALLSALGGCVVFKGAVNMGNCLDEYH